MFVHQLALTVDQVKEWNLPARKASKDKPESKWTKQVREFIAKHGDAAVELDAIPPNTLRQLIDDAIAKHADERAIETLKDIEVQERESLCTWLQIGRETCGEEDDEDNEDDENDEDE